MGYWGIDMPNWFPSGRSDSKGAGGSGAGTTVTSSGSTGQGVQWGGKNVVIDLKNGVVSVFVTKWVPEYNTRVVSRYMTRHVRVITALTINYILNGQVYTSVVIPTHIVVREGGAQATRRKGVRSVPNRNVPAKIIV